jgi:pyruvate kinase
LIVEKVMNADLHGATATEVMATVGPTLETAEDLLRAAEAGARWFRLPLGYRQRAHRTHARVVAGLRERFHPPVRLLLDLPSSRPRTGSMDELSPAVGAVVVFHDPSAGAGAAPSDAPHRVPLPGLNALLSKLSPGQRMLFLDGRVEFRVEAVYPAHVSARWQRGEHPLKAGNSLFLPDSRSPFLMVTPEDVAILRGLAEDGTVPDWVALSLVSSAEDVEAGREAVRAVFPGPVRIMAKVETRAAVEDQLAIVRQADGIMVARGDLGQAVPFEELPGAQEDLVRVARAAGKITVVATQFLEVFAETGVPQRPELSDLALAARQRATAIMLGKETVYSKRPIESIRLAASVLEAEARRLQAGPGKPARLALPGKGRGGGGEPVLVAIEGPNGAGKTTLCRLLCERDGYGYRRGVPAAWEEPGLKLRMIRDADWLASAMFFLSGAIEVRRELRGEGARTVVMDRSLWSTLAVHYAHDPSRLRELLPVLESAASHLVVPDLTIVLEASPSSCRERVRLKTGQARVFDEAAPADEEFLGRERDFYRWLSQQGPRVTFINADGRDAEAVHELAAAAIREAGLC